MTLDRAKAFRLMWLDALNHYARGIAEQCDEMVGLWEQLDNELPEDDKQRLLGASVANWPPTLVEMFNPIYARLAGYTQKWRRIVARFEVAHARCEAMWEKRVN